MSTNLLISIVTNMFQVDKIDIVVAFWNNIFVSKLAAFNAKDKVSDRRRTKLLMEEVYYAIVLYSFIDPFYLIDSVDNLRPCVYFIKQFIFFAVMSGPLRT